MLLAVTRENDLAELARRFDTDKGPEYLSVYHGLLAHRRDEPLRLLEIGLYNGGSLELWRAYCPQAELYGIDIDPRCLAYEALVPGSLVRLVDEADPAQLEAFVTESGGRFDLVIDDGGHHMPQQVTSFQSLWRHVEPGGAYVIEDLGTSYFRDFGGGGLGAPGTSVALAKGLADAVNRHDASPARACSSGWEPTVSEHEYEQLLPDVAAVHFFPGQAVVVKAF